MARRTAAPLLLLALLGCAAGRVMSEEPMPAAGAVEPANLGKAHAILIESTIDFPNGASTFTVECPAKYVPLSFGIQVPNAALISCDTRFFLNDISLGEPTFTATCTANGAVTGLLQGVCIKGKPAKVSLDITEVDSFAPPKAMSLSSTAEQVAAGIPAKKAGLVGTVFNNPSSKGAAAVAAVSPVKVHGKVDLLLVGGDALVPASEVGIYEASCPEGFTPFASGAVPSSAFFSTADNQLSNAIFIGQWSTIATGGTPSINFLGLCISNANPIDVDSTVEPNNRRLLQEQESALPADGSAAQGHHDDDDNEDDDVGSTGLLYAKTTFDVPANKFLRVELSPKKAKGDYLAVQANTFIDDLDTKHKALAAAADASGAAPTGGLFNADVKPAVPIASTCVPVSTTELNTPASREGIFTLLCAGGPDGFQLTWFGVFARAVEAVPVDVTVTVDHY